jgi:type I restriction enzyme M protein
MDNTPLNWIANFIWGIADDVLRNICARGPSLNVVGNG